MKIGDAASKSGLTERAVRLYESMGLVKPEIKRSGGRSYRDYRDRDVERLRVIAELRRSMFTLDEIAAMINDPETIGDAVAKSTVRVDREAAALTAISDKLDRVCGVYDAGALANALSDLEIPSDDDDVGDDIVDIDGDAYGVETADDDAPTLLERIREFMHRFADMFYTASGHLSPVRILAAVAAFLAVIALVVSTPITSVKTHRYAGISLTLDDLPIDSVDGCDVCENAASMTVKRKRYLFREPSVEGDIGIYESVLSGGDGAVLTAAFSTNANRITALHNRPGVKIYLAGGHIIYADSEFENLVVVIVDSGGYTEHVILLSSTCNMGRAIDFFKNARVELPANIESEGDAQ